MANKFTAPRYLIIKYNVDQLTDKYYLKDYVIIRKPDNIHIDYVEFEWTRSLDEAKKLSESKADEFYYKFGEYTNCYPYLTYIETFAKEVKEIGYY